MSKYRRRDWTAYGMPQILAQLSGMEVFALGSDIPGQVEPGGLKARDERSVLTPESATLYWMQKSAIDVAVGLAAHRVPSHTVAELFRSSDIATPGLMCFEKPIATLQRNTASGSIDLSWDALLWDRIRDDRLGELDVDLMYFVLLSRMTTCRHILGPEHRDLPLLAVKVLSAASEEPLWPESEHWHEHDHTEVDEADAPDLNANVKLMTSILLTAGQPRLTAQKVIGAGEGVVIPRRDRGDADKLSPEVVLIDLLRPPTHLSDTRASEKGRDYDHRWWVRGYYRMQPYGPESSLRKSIYIFPHTAGPEDKPLSDRPRVNVIRTNPAASPTDAGPGHREDPPPPGSLST